METLTSHQLLNLLGVEVAGIRSQKIRSGQSRLPIERVLTRDRICVSRTLIKGSASLRTRVNGSNFRLGPSEYPQVAGSERVSSVGKRKDLRLNDTAVS